MKNSSWSAACRCASVAGPNHRSPPTTAMDTLTQLIAFLALAVLVLALLYPLRDDPNDDADD